MMKSFSNWRSRSSSTAWYPWLVFISVVSGPFMSNLDSSIMNVALPVLERYFHVGPSELQWVISAYVLMITGILPIVGSLSDRMNRKFVFIFGASVFTGGSILCAFSFSIQELIMFRIIQSVGAAVLMANSMSIVTHVFPSGRRGKPLGLTGSAVAAGTIVGPSLGGILITWFGWRTIFWVNVPIGIISILMTSLLMIDILPEKKSEPFDSWGGTYFFVAIVSLLVFVSEGQIWGWISLASYVSLLVSVLGWILFIRRELRTEEPIINLRLFKSVPFFLGNASGYLFFIMMMFPSFILPLYMHHVLHIPLAKIGLLLTPQAISMIIFSPMGGWLADRFGTSWPIVVGMSLTTFGLYLLARMDISSSYYYIILSLSVFGLGMGLFTSPNNVSVLDSVPKQETGLTSSLIATVRNFGRVSGVAIAVLLLDINKENLQTVRGYSHSASFAFFGSVIVGLIGILLNFIRIWMQWTKRSSLRRNYNIN